MDSDTQEQILKWFKLASGEVGAGETTAGTNQSAADSALSEFSPQIDSGTGASGADKRARPTAIAADTYGGIVPYETEQPEMEAAATSSGQNVHGGPQTDSQTSGGTSVASILTDVFESGFGIAPVVGELLGLFGGGDKTPTAPVKYQMPPSIWFMSAETGDGLGAAGYDQMGAARLYDDSGGAIGENGQGRAPAAESGTPGAAAPAPQITVNVQAMDARSFLDRSSDIAQAVRNAMLSMNSINDIVNEL